jgi:hypothetical protein
VVMTSQGHCPKAGTRITAMTSHVNESNHLLNRAFGSLNALAEAVKCADPRRTTGSRTGRALQLGLWLDWCLRFVNSTLQASRRIPDHRETLRVVFDSRRRVTRQAKVTRVARHTDHYRRFWEVMTDGGSKPTDGIQPSATPEELLSNQASAKVYWRHDEPREGKEEEIRQTIRISSFLFSSRCLTRFREAKALQRSVLFWDNLRKRGNNFIEHAVAA